MNNIRNITQTIVLVFAVFSLFSSCKEEVLPKPASFLSLEYPIAKYEHFENQCPFTFDINTETIIK
jgi:hypothetical protein